jgi:hypothetical protein
MEALEYEQELDRYRGWLAEELDEEDVPDDVWGYLIKLGLLYEAITGSDDESRQALVARARAYMKKSREQNETYVQPPGRSEDRGAPDEVAVKPSKNVTRTAEVLAEVAATLSNSDTEVQRFRRKYLGGQLLTDEEARAFLNERGGPQGTGKAVRRAARNPRWSLHPQAKRYSTPIEMRELLGLADRLSKTFGWREGDGLWFVLTGFVPPIRPLEVEMFINTSAWPSRYHDPFMARISVTSYVWVNAEVVERAFRDAQRQLLGGDAPPPADKRTLEVVRFVASRLRESKEETWKNCWRAWNRLCREKWRYNSYNGFRQVYDRFMKRYMHRKYEPPNYVKREKTPYEVYRDQWNAQFTGKKGRHVG